MLPFFIPQNHCKLNKRQKYILMKIINSIEHKTFKKHLCRLRINIDRQKQLSKFLLENLFESMFSDKCISVVLAVEFAWEQRHDYIFWYLISITMR